MNPINTGTGVSAGTITALGVFPGYAEARRAVDALRGAGFRDDQIGVLGPTEAEAIREKRSGLANDPTHTHWEEGAGIGAAAGGLAGLGLGAAVAAGLVSPLGPVVAGGTLVALLASAGAGATVGTVVGALAGLGVPEDDARWLADELEGGNVLVTVRSADADADRAADILHDRATGRRAPSGAAVYGRAARDRVPDDTAVRGNDLPATPY